MTEAGDFDPGVWKGYDFDSARKAYDVHVGRSYEDALSSGKCRDDLVPSSIRTESESPLVIACDVTGSMGDWPATIFSKLPYLELEGQEYLGEGMEISFAAIGDCYTDDYPLQVRPFTSGKNLEKELKELVIEGNGGGQMHESYDLGALYYSRNVEIPNAISPVFIFIGDEMPYDFVDKGAAKDWAGSSLQERVSTGDVIEGLKQKFSTYLIRKPYDFNSRDSMSDEDQEINRSWSQYIDQEHTAILPNANIVVDVIFGLLAKETSRINYFEDELKGRQRPDQVSEVLKSLHSVHYLKNKSVPKLGSGKSIMKRNDGGGKASKSLI